MRVNLLVCYSELTPNDTANIIPSVPAIHFYRLSLPIAGICRLEEASGQGWSHRLPEELDCIENVLNWVDSPTNMSSVCHSRCHVGGISSLQCSCIVWLGAYCSSLCSGAGRSAKVRNYSGLGNITVECVLWQTVIQSGLIRRIWVPATSLASETLDCVILLPLQYSQI